jgi:hypothetical protein
MKQEISTVLVSKGQKNSYDAFDVDEEDFERKVVKVGLGENDNLVQIGRLLIKNRVKPFTVTFMKSQMAIPLQFKILVCIDDVKFKNPTEYSFIA